MLKITLASYTADLDEASISIVMTSPFPLMGAGLDGGNYIYNFTLPATPELKKTFHHAHRPGSIGGGAAVPFTIDASGIRYSGTASLVEADAFTYEVMCPVGNGSFNMRSKEVKLPALDMGGEMGSQLPALIAETGVAVYFDDQDTSSFTITKTLPFKSFISNCDELSADGLLFTAATARAANITLALDASFSQGSLQVKLYKNASAIKTWAIITGAEVLTHDFDLVVADTLYIQMVGTAEVVNDALYAMSGVVYDGTRLTVSAANQSFLMIEGATSRWPDVSFAVFPIENPRIFDNWPDDQFSVDNVSIKTLYSEYFKVINYWHGGEFPETLSTTVNDEGFEAGNLFVPFPYIAFLVQRVANYFGFRIINNVFDDELKYAVLINFFVENSFLTDDPSLMAPNDTFRLNDHVPDWTVYDFMQHVCHLFGIGYEVDDELQTLTFTFVKDLFDSSDYVDISHLVVAPPRADWSYQPTGYSLAQEFPSNDSLGSEIKSLEGLNYKGVAIFLNDLPSSGNSVNDCYWVWISNKYYAWQYDPEEYKFAWVKHSIRHKLEVTSGIVSEEITTQLPAVVNVMNTITGVKGWAIPASHQPGIFEGAPDVYSSEWAPLVAWYHGLKTDTNAATYPYASSDCVDMDGNLITDVPFSLKLDGFRNVYDTQWKTYLEWRKAAKPVRVSIIPDRTFLRTFEFAKKVRFGGANYLVAEARGNINRLGPDVWELVLLVV